MKRYSITFPSAYMFICVTLIIFWLIYGGGDTFSLAVQLFFMGGLFLIMLLGEIVDLLLELNQHLHRSQTKSTSTDVPSSG